MYLIPRGLRLVSPILQALPQELRLVSYMAPIPDIKASSRRLITPAHQPSAQWPLYLYHINKPEETEGKNEESAS